MTNQKRPRGRPQRESSPSSERLVIRCTTAELRGYEAAAAKVGQTLADFVRDALDAWMGRKTR